MYSRAGFDLVRTRVLAQSSGPEGHRHDKFGKCALNYLMWHLGRDLTGLTTRQGSTVNYSAARSLSRRRSAAAGRGRRPHRRTPPVADRCRHRTRRRRFAVFTPLCPPDRASPDPTEAPPSLKLGLPKCGRPRFPGKWRDQVRQGRPGPGHLRPTEYHMPHLIRSVPRRASTDLNSAPNVHRKRR
jgi:hypothetical protein